MPTHSDRAREILRANDLGGYTIPTKRLYPFQWNWDSGFCSLGIATFDEPRAWQELAMLFRGQWEDGLVPHIVFHQDSRDYFPGPDVWGVTRSPATSGITQPPVAATMVRLLLDRAADRRAAEAAARLLYPKLLANHRWWAEARDPEGTGLVVIYHPWETGMDNSPAWDAALARVPETRNRTYQRRDTAHVDATQRPRQAEYDRYMYLVELFRSHDYAPAALYAESPFRVADLCVNSVLQRATEDLVTLAERFGTPEDRRWLAGRIALGRAAFERLWDAENGRYCSLDTRDGGLIRTATSASFLPLYGGVVPEERVARLGRDLDDWSGPGTFLVPSTHPAASTFDARRYWRGPIWVVVNWMIADGLTRSGLVETAERLRRDTARLVEEHGFFEYFDPTTGAGLGGGDFSWTAAMYLAWAGRA